MQKWIVMIMGLWVVLIGPAPMFGQEVEFKSSKAKAALREYERKLGDVDKELGQQLRDLEKNYQMKVELIRARLLSNLTEAMEEEARRVNVEEANKIRGALQTAKEIEPATLEELVGNRVKKPAKAIQPKVRIPKTALKFNGHHYAICTDPMTWHRARAYCETLGGHLASINTKQEFNFLDQAFFQRNLKLYLDGSDEAKENEWVFSSGRKVNFSNIPADRRKINGVDHHHHLACLKQVIHDDPPGFRLPFIIEWDE